MSPDAPKLQIWSDSWMLFLKYHHSQTFWEQHTDEHTDKCMY